MANKLTQLTKNFSLEEFACKDGTPVPDNLIPNALRLATELQKLRDILSAILGKDCPISINSGYRTPEYNKNIESAAPHSKHMSAQAADCTCIYFTPDQFADLVDWLIRAGKIKFKGLGRYRGFTHVDVRQTVRVARWDKR